MDNKIPSRTSLQKTHFAPVDPAFRPKKPSKDGTLPKPGEDSNQHDYPSSFYPAVSQEGSEQKNLTEGKTVPENSEKAVPENLPKNPTNHNAVQHTSSDVKSEESATDQSDNGLLNLKEFPDLKDSQKNDSETKKILTIGGIIASVIILTAGILFLVAGGKKEENEEPKTPATEDDAAQKAALEKIKTEAEKTEEDKEENKISEKDTKTQKYLTATNNINLIEEIENSFSKIREENSQEEIRIIFQNENEEPLSLKNLTEKLGVFIPDYVAEILDPDYYFFLANIPANSTPKASIILESKFSDYKKTEEVLQRWEKYLVQDLKNFIFLGEDADFFNNFIKESEIYSLDFYSSEKYPGGRYQNFLKDGSISLNYLVMQDKIIIANSFEAFEKIIRHVELDENL
jgi:hypothetical protein